MTSKEAREILLLYRPGTRDAEDPEVVEAMGVARGDPELGKWFDQHQAFQVAMRAKLRELQAPEHLKLALTAPPKVVPLPRVWWQQPAWLAAAAMFVMLLTVVFWPKPRVHDRFADYRLTMVVAAENPYLMDWTNSDMRLLRAKLAEKRAPDSYSLTPELAKLQLTGGAALTWRNNRVSMVCFDRGNKLMVFLFVLPRSALKDPPPATPEVLKVDALTTASWSRGELTYVLAGQPERDFEKYLDHP